MLKKTLVKVKSLLSLKSFKVHIQCTQTGFLVQEVLLFKIKLYISRRERRFYKKRSPYIQTKDRKSKIMDKYMCIVFATTENQNGEWVF